MPVFEPKTFPDFFQRMLNRVVARTELTDLEAGGVLSTVVGAVARELDDISYQIVALQDLWDLDTATGDDLDARAADANPAEITRKLGVPAVGTVVFGRSTAPAAVTVSAGTIVAVTGGSPQYRTTASVTLGVGVLESTPVGVVAIVPGAAGNVGPGNAATATGITEIVVNVAGIETVINDTACTGGQDRETDQQLRARIKAYLRSLSRATPGALRASVLGVELPGFGRIVSADVEELAFPNYGRVNVWIDDGNGTAAVVGDNIGARETIIDPAIGGEIRLSLSRGALVDSAPPTITWRDHNNYNGAGIDVEHPLVEGELGDALSTYDFSVNYATGVVTINPDGPTSIPNATTSAANVAGLQPGDALFGEYTYYEGLIAEAQKIIDGDASDRSNYPGYRAAGTYVKVLPPTIYLQQIEATIVLAPGYDYDTVRASVAAALESYVNALGINGDVIFSELVNAAQEVEGVFDVVFTRPDQTAASPNVIIGSGELARTSQAYITINGA
jgi:uncharacterized phage protein gp47/JayE